MEPVNYTLYIRANSILGKMETINNIQYTYLINNYEPEKKHLYFMKIKSLIERGPPRKIYTVRDT